VCGKAKSVWASGSSRCCGSHISFAFFLLSRSWRNKIWLIFCAARVCMCAPVIFNKVSAPGLAHVQGCKAPLITTPGCPYCRQGWRSVCERESVAIGDGIIILWHTTSLRLYLHSALSGEITLRILPPWIRCKLCAKYLQIPLNTTKCAQIHLLLMEITKSRGIMVACSTCKCRKCRCWRPKLIFTYCLCSPLHLWYKL
jgi:hypothetical protein